MVDKNLFLHDLAVVAILKNEAPYLKEWLDYHLLAGVDHFYLYDNDSPDNQREVAKPYVAAGLVDWFDAPGEAMQYAVYNDAVKRFKFHCRYMAFIDGDEFIFPRTGGGIIETVDEILSNLPYAGELSISWQIFGSNGHERADYSKGVLERFTRRESNEPNLHKTFGCKCIADPRKIKLIESPHNTTLLEGLVRVTEDGKIKTCQAWRLEPVHAEKIVVNHYRCMSWEEFSKRAPRGEASSIDGSKYSSEFFKQVDHNEVFDDGILRYRDERAKTFQSPDKSRAAERLLNALTVNLSPTLLPTMPPNFYTGKLETFLTCREVAAYLKTKLVDDAIAKFFEEAALKAILQSFTGGTSLADLRLFLRELPKLLDLPYPVAKEIRVAALQLIPQMMHIFHLNNMWKDFAELDYLNDILKLGG